MCLRGKRGGRWPRQCDASQSALPPWARLTGRASRPVEPMSARDGSHDAITRVFALRWDVETAGPEMAKLWRVGHDLRLRRVLVGEPAATACARTRGGFVCGVVE